MYAIAIKEAIASTFFTLNEDDFAFAEGTVGGTGAKLGCSAILSFGKAGSGRVFVFNWWMDTANAQTAQRNALK